MSKFHYIIVLILVLIITTLTYRLSTSVDKPTAATDPSLRHDPDYFISDFKATMYDKSGAANYRITAQHLEHFPDTDTVEIQHLIVEYIDTTQLVWQATAEAGIGYKNTEIMHLSGNVKIKRQTPDPDKNLVMETDKLRIDFANRRASTDTKVKITGKNSTINAIGMDVNLDTGTLSLRSRARGHYVPY